MKTIKLLFFFALDTGEGDKCKCFYCGGILWDWEPGDDPWVEHAKWFEDCPWIKMAKGSQFIERIKQVIFMFTVYYLVHVYSIPCIIFMFTVYCLQ